jgi:hypothetical protein
MEKWRAQRVSHCGRDGNPSEWGCPENPQVNEGPRPRRQLTTSVSVAVCVVLPDMPVAVIV